MAYRRRRATRSRRKTRRTRRKTYKRKTVKRSRGMTWNPQYFKVKRNFQLTGPGDDYTAGVFPYADPYIISSTTNVNGYTSGSFTFNIEHVPGVSEFGNLFDQYKISGVSLSIRHLSGTELATETNTAGGTTQCAFMVWTDLDDNDIPTPNSTQWKAVAETGRTKLRYFPGGKNVMKIFVRPKLALIAQDSTGTYDVKVLANNWVDGNVDEPARYYGVKWMIQSNPSIGITHRFRVNATYYLQFKGRR